MEMSGLWNLMCSLSGLREANLGPPEEADIGAVQCVRHLATGQPGQGTWSLREKAVCVMSQGSSGGGSVA